jgi:uncharacterized protein GlcG (DUF336 family)
MHLILIAALFLLPISVLAEDDAPSVSVKRLTLDAATNVAQAAIKACREQGVQAGVTVLDRNGIVQATLRDTLAPPVTLYISKGKAQAAVNFGVSTDALQDRANTPIGRVPGLVMATGGLLIEAGGVLYGAVGVSGAPSGETDQACAQAGVDAVLEDLEMAM